MHTEECFEARERATGKRDLYNIGSFRRFVGDELRKAALDILPHHEKLSSRCFRMAQAIRDEDSAADAHALLKVVQERR